MNEQRSRQLDIPRSQWPRMLAALPQADVIALAEELAEHFDVQPLRIPEAGLALLPLRDGCFGEAFNLCEMPLAEAAIELVDAGGRWQGGARVMASDAGYARAVAVLDAVLAHGLRGFEQARQLLALGAAVVAEEHARRSEIVARTRVDFTALAFAGEADESD